MSRSTVAVEKWREIVAEQEASGQTVAEFCRQRGLPASSLFAWRRRLRPAGGPAAFVEVSASPAGGTAERQADGGVEVLCAGGRRIGIRRGFDPDVLRQAIKALETLA